MSIKKKPTSQLTTSGILMNQLIRRLSQTPQGFQVADADHLNIKDSRIFKCAGRMIKAGILHRSKVTGNPVRYHASPELSQAWIAATPARYAEPKPRERKTPPGQLLQMQKSILLTDAIYAGATSPKGFVIADRPRELAEDSVRRRCLDMVKQGLLFSAMAEFRVLHYFTTHQAALQYRADFIARNEAKVKARVKPYAPVIARKPYVAPKPKSDAEIVHTAQTRYVIAQTPPQRFTAFELPSFVHGGMSQMR